MAITVQQQASLLQPVYNEITYIFSSTNVTQTNFKFVVDIYLGSTKIDRLLVPPHPTYLTGLANIAPMLESRVSKDIAITDDRMMPNNNSYLTYTLKVGEAYGSSGTTIYPNLATISGKYVWNGIYDYPDYVGYSSGDVTCDPSTPAPFLTNRPSSGDIELDDNAWLYWCNMKLNTSYAYIVTRDSSLSTLNTFKVDCKNTTTPFLRIPSGPANLNIIDAAVLLTGSQPIITGTEHSYSIQIFNNSNQQISERYYYTLADFCTKYTKHRLVFFNKLGGYDTFDFTKVSKETGDIERSIYKKNLGSYASSTSFRYALNDRANSQFHTKIKDKVTLESDWVTEEQLVWLEELVTSPDVYYDDGTTLISINITNSSFERKKQVNKHLFNLQVEYTLSYDRYRQRL